MEALAAPGIYCIRQPREGLCLRRTIGSVGALFGHRQENEAFWVFDKTEEKKNISDVRYTCSDEDQKHK